ncbi:hypothetical protein CEK71_19330 [Methylovulum psychrotolerans]|uniref:PEP-CTERM sorting domain-containing protein n=2 Tax=Methylovulum psychrotolerans TaxID=1704499 RepID=A0A1Z4C3C4_9GAMM|nr:hypothetical protein CEK71_19330 [Methylovulum psychrotolerans]
MKIKRNLLLALALSSGVAHANMVNSNLSGFTAIGSAELSSVDYINNQDKGAAFQANRIQAVPGSGGNTSVVNMADTWNIHDGVHNNAYSGVSTVVNGLIAGRTYALSFYESAANRTPAGSGNPSFTTTGANTTLYWAVSLGGGLVVNSTRVTMDTSKDYALPWTLVTVNVTAGAGNNLLQFLANSTLGVSPEPLLLLGNVVLTTSNLPEPNIIWLLFSGVLAASIGLKRRNTTV